MKKTIIFAVMFVMLFAISCKDRDPCPTCPEPVLPQYGKLTVDYYSDGTHPEDAYVLLTTSWNNYCSVQMTRLGPGHWQYIEENLAVNAQYYRDTERAHYAKVTHAGYRMTSGVLFNSTEVKNILNTGNGPLWYFWFDGTNILQ